MRCRDVLGCGVVINIYKIIARILLHDGGNI